MPALPERLLGGIHLATGFRNGIGISCLPCPTDGSTGCHEPRDKHISLVFSKREVGEAPKGSANNEISAVRVTR